jgi:hypothetical protein
MPGLGPGIHALSSPRVIAVPRPKDPAINPAIHALSSPRVMPGPRTSLVPGIHALSSSLVMPGLVPGIHAFLVCAGKFVANMAC